MATGSQPQSSTINPCQLGSLLTALTAAEEYAYRRSDWAENLRSANNQSTGAQLLSRGHCIEEIHQYFSSFESRRCCLTLASGQNSLQLIRVVKVRDSLIECLSPTSSTSSSDVRSFTGCRLTEDEFRIFGRALLCASCPLLTVPELPDEPDFNLPPKSSAFPFSAARSAPRHDPPVPPGCPSSSVCSAGSGAGRSLDARVCAPEDLCLISIDILKDVLRRAFGLSTEASFEFQRMVFEPHRRKQQPLILAEDLVFQLSVLETHRHPYYARDKFPSPRAYERWCQGVRQLIMELLGKFWHMALPPLGSRPRYTISCIHNDYAELLQKLIRYENGEKKATGDFVPQDQPVLSGPCERLLAEFALRHGIDEVFRKAAMLEYLSVNFDLDLCFVKKVTVAVGDVLHLLLPNRTEMILVCQQIDQLIETSKRLLRHCRHILTRLDRLPSLPLQTSSSEFIDLIIKLLTKSAELYEYFSPDDALPVEQMLQRDIRDSFGVVYKQYKAIATSELDTVQISPQLVNRLLTFIRDNVVRYSASFQTVFSRYFDITHLAAIEWYRLLMDDVAELVRQNDDTTSAASNDVSLVGLMHRLNSLDIDWSQFIPRSEQTWRRRFVDVILTRFSVIQQESLQLLLKSLSCDKFETLPLILSSGNNEVERCQRNVLLLSRSLTASTHSAFDAFSSPFHRPQIKPTEVSTPNENNSSVYPVPLNSSFVQSHVTTDSLPGENDGNSMTSSELCSNWIYSDQTTDVPSVPVDLQVYCSSAESVVTLVGSDEGCHQQQLMSADNLTSSFCPVQVVQVDRREFVVSVSGRLRLKLDDLVEPVVESNQRIVVRSEDSMSALTGSDDKNIYENCSPAHNLGNNISPGTILIEQYNQSTSFHAVDGPEANSFLKLLCVTNDTDKTSTVSSTNDNETVSYTADSSRSPSPCSSDSIIVLSAEPLDGHPTIEISGKSPADATVVNFSTDVEPKRYHPVANLRQSNADSAAGTSCSGGGSPLQQSSSTSSSGISDEGCYAAPSDGDIICHVDSSSGRLFIGNRETNYPESDRLVSVGNTSQPYLSSSAGGIQKPLPMHWQLESSSSSTEEPSIDTADLLQSQEIQILLKSDVLSLENSLELPSAGLSAVFPDESALMSNPCPLMSASIMAPDGRDSEDTRPKVSLRLSSSLVDLISLLQRIVKLAETWSRVLCTAEADHTHCGGIETNSSARQLVSDPASRHLSSDSALGFVGCDLCALAATRNTIQQHITGAVEQLIDVYALNLLAMDVCGLGAQTARSLVDEKLLTFLTTDSQHQQHPKLVWGCRHKVHGTSCKIDVDRTEGTSREMCMRINDAAQLECILNHFGRQVCDRDRQASGQQTSTTNHNTHRPPSMCCLSCVRGVTEALVNLLAYRLCCSLETILDNALANAGGLLPLLRRSRLRIRSTVVHSRSMFPHVAVSSSAHPRSRSAISVDVPRSLSDRSAENLTDFTIASMSSFRGGETFDGGEYRSDAVSSVVSSLLQPVTDFLVQHTAVLCSWLAADSYQRLLDLLARQIAKGLEKRVHSLCRSCSAVEDIEPHSAILCQLISLLIKAGNDCVHCVTARCKFGALVERYTQTVRLWLQLYSRPTAHLVHIYRMVNDTSRQARTSKQQTSTQEHQLHSSTNGTDTEHQLGLSRFSAVGGIHEIPHSQNGFSTKENIFRHSTDVRFAPSVMHSSLRPTTDTHPESLERAPLLNNYMQADFDVVDDAAAAAAAAAAANVSAAECDADTLNYENSENETEVKVRPDFPEMCNRENPAAAADDFGDVFDREFFDDHHVDGALLVDILASRRHRDADARQFVLDVTSRAARSDHDIRRNPVLICLDIAD